jgi:putative membrane protein insertion efficiency factor
MAFERSATNSSVESRVGSGAHPPARLGARLLLALIAGYRLALAPFLGGFCRFVPSCSVYAEEAVRRHGAVRGLRLAALRLSRCHPFHRGGLDPVP